MVLDGRGPGLHNTRTDLSLTSLMAPLITIMSEWNCVRLCISVYVCLYILCAIVYLIWYSVCVCVHVRACVHSGAHVPVSMRCTYVSART